MLNSGLFFLRVVEAYKIYTEFVPWQFFKIIINFFRRVNWPLSFIDFLIWRRHISSLWLILGLYNYWWWITSFESSIWKKETHMFYVASVIAFSAFLELLRMPNILVPYKLDIFRPTRLNFFDVRELLFGG